MEQEVTLSVRDVWDGSALQMRETVQEAAVSTVYRHVCAEAAVAASGQAWSERARLMQIARSIELAYPAATAKARFAT